MLKEIQQPILKPVVWDPVKQLSLMGADLFWEHGREFISVNLTDPGIANFM